MNGLGVNALAKSGNVVYIGGKFETVGGIESPNFAGIPDTLQTSVKEGNSLTPQSFNLSQNYPNPFLSGAKSPALGGGNPTTTIRYALPKTVYVKLTIFNLLGREIETLVSNVQAAGEYEIHWHPRHLISGVYLYRLQAGNFVETKKMLVVK